MIVLNHHSLSLITHTTPYVNENKLTVDFIFCKVVFFYEICTLKKIFLRLLQSG